MDDEPRDDDKSDEPDMTAAQTEFDESLDEYMIAWEGALTKEMTDAPE